jgi:hypothetical protein
MPARHRTVWTAAAAVLSLAVAACGAAGPSTGSAPATGSATAVSAAPSGPLSLAGVCPDRVVIQSDWWPQAEYGPFFQLMGGHPTVDANRKRVTAPLVVRGVDTGVRLEIRSGGPANSYLPPSRVLYLDKDVLFGSVDIDQVAQLSGSAQPVRAVFAPMDKSPVVLMWDPATHPDFHTVADVGRAGTRVLYFPGSAYMDYLVGSGKLHKQQVEASYDGTPARFIAERGRIVQQGYLTNEVYQYEHELPQWKKKVAWTLVNDAGYPNYPETMAIRKDRQAELSPCLHKLVPILQRAEVDYVRDPAPANALIVALVKDFNAFPYSPQRAQYAVQAMVDNGLFGNGGNGTVGDFDAGRVDHIIEAVRPIGAKAGDLMTNEFIDTAVGLP